MPTPKAISKLQDYYDKLTALEPHGIQHTGNKYVDNGITALSNIGAGGIGLAQPLVHPLNTLKTLGRLTPMAAADDYFSKRPTIYQEAGKSILQHPLETAEQGLGGFAAAGGLGELADAGQLGLTNSLVKRAGAEQAGKNAVNSRVSSLIQDLNQPTPEPRAYSPKPLARPSVPPAPSAPPEASIDPNKGIGPVTSDNPLDAYPHLVPPKGQNSVQSGIYQAPKTPYLLPGQHPASSAGINRIMSFVDDYLPNDRPNYYQKVLENNPVGQPLTDSEAAKIVSGPPTFPRVPKGLHPATGPGQQYVNDLVTKMLNDMGHENEE